MRSYLKALTLGAFFVQCQISRASPTPELQKLLKSGELKIALMSEDRWPFWYVDKSGHLQGIDVEIARGFAKSLGLKANIQRTSKGFNSTLNTVVKNEANIALAALYPTVERAFDLRFSDPYCEIKGAFVQKRILRSTASSQERVGTQRDTLFSSALEGRFPQSQIILYSKTKELWDDLKAGKLSSIYVDMLEVKKKQLLTKDFNLFFKVRVDTASTFPVAVALQRKQEQLTELLNLWIKNELAIGNLDRLCAQAAKLK